MKFVLLQLYINNNYYVDPSLHFLLIKTID